MSNSEGNPMINDEINKIIGERKANEVKIDGFKTSFANELKNGLGDEIKKALTEAREPVKEPKKNKIKSIFQRLADIWQE